MSPRILISALLLWGSVGATVCEAICAQSAQAPATLAEANACPHHSDAEPRPGPAEPADSGLDGCCEGASSVVATTTTADVVSPLLAVALPVEPVLDHPARVTRRDARPPDLATSPFLRQNPPLLS
jgi:hypothetical protein